MMEKACSCENYRKPVRHALRMEKEQKDGGQTGGYRIGFFRVYPPARTGRLHQERHNTGQAILRTGWICSHVVRGVPKLFLGQPDDIFLKRRQIFCAFLETDPGKIAEQMTRHAADAERCPLSQMHSCRQNSGVQNLRVFINI